LYYNSTFIENQDKNVKQNLINRCTIFPGDNRRAIIGYSLRQHIDRVNLGLIPTCLDGLTNAMISLSSERRIESNNVATPMTHSMLHIHWNIDLHNIPHKAGNLKQILLREDILEAEIYSQLKKRKKVLNLIQNLTICQLYTRYYPVISQSGTRQNPQLLEELGQLADINLDLSPLLVEFNTFIQSDDFVQNFAPNFPDDSHSQIEHSFTSYLHHKYSSGSLSPLLSGQWAGKPLWGAGKENITFDIVDVFVVKSYGPKVYHVVYDVLCSVGDDLSLGVLDWYDGIKKKEKSLVQNNSKTLTPTAKSYLNTIDESMRGFFTPNTNVIVGHSSLISSPVTGFEMAEPLKTYITDIYSKTTPLTVLIPQSSQNTITSGLNNHYNFPPTLEQQFRSSMLTQPTTFLDFFNFGDLVNIIETRPHEVPVVYDTINGPVGGHSGVKITHDDFISTILPLQCPVLIKQYYNPQNLAKIWDSTPIMKELSPENPPLSIHKASSPYMNMLPRNFTFETTNFHQFLDLIHENSALSFGKEQSQNNRPEENCPVLPSGNENEKQQFYYYLRSMGTNSRRDVSNVNKTFPQLSKTVPFPRYIPETSYFSSILRVSSMYLQLWAHFDVADNFLIQCSGYKRVTLFHPMFAQLLGVQTSQDSSSVPYTRLDLERMLSNSDCQFEKIDKFEKIEKIKQNSLLMNYVQNYPGLFLSFPYRHEVILEPGDVLFIPSLWLHHIETIPPPPDIENNQQNCPAINSNQHNPNSDQHNQNNQHNQNVMAISINIFWRHLKQSFYQPKDVYGNKDLIDGANMLNLSTQIKSIMSTGSVNAIKNDKNQTKNCNNTNQIGEDIIPLHYRNFYSTRIIQDLIQQYCQINKP
jgi:tRNA wybutosine-synthesizing protein 5